VLAAIAAIAQIFFASDVAEKDRFWLHIPACGLLAVALLLPVLWRSSSGTRAAAVGYLGFPGGMVVGLPFNFLPASVEPFAVAAAVLAVAALIFFLEHRATVTLSPAEGWVSTRGRTLRFDEVAGVVWDGLQITTPGTFSSSDEDLARLDLIGPDRTRITLDTTNYRNATAAIHKMRDWSVEHLVERIAAAVADGDEVRAGPITFAPTGITLQRPRPWSASAVIVVFAVLGILPTVIAVALLIDQSHFNPRPLLIFTPLVVVLIIMAIQAHLLRKPLTFPSDTAATIENGQLLIRTRTAKRAISIELRYLENGLLVPPLLSGAVPRRGVS
jgi:hypothetical protein